ncbi:site-specific integrase [Halogeometricum borinquense]|uniref:Site-specific integrase n=1 Tax=Halogeometricum borinquense TaxID=60847 RepID=A0A6C0UJ25_9EURY|nr:site-specific integrase [Halogeometricum borinquense]QIB75217.1 site-specific integrase [Halogeometricum borinquense]
MSEKHMFLEVEQIDRMRDACYSRDQRYDTAKRDETIVTVLADFGLRVSELLDLKRYMFDLENEELQLPNDIQKQPPTDAEAGDAILEIDPYDEFNTIRLLRDYFRENDFTHREFIFHSRQSETMSRQNLNMMLKDVAEEAEIHPRRIGQPPAEPREIHAHAFRHSLANYMLRDSDTRLIDVRNRLRHKSVRTTEDIYEHFQRG